MVAVRLDWRSVLVSIDRQDDYAGGVSQQHSEELEVVDDVDGSCKSQISLRYLLADRFEAGRGPVADLLARASSLLDAGPDSSSLQICGQLRTCLRPDSVMEFGPNDGDIILWVASSFKRVFRATASSSRHCDAVSEGG